MSELRTNRIVPRDGLPAGSSGGVIQVRSVTKTDTFTKPTNTTAFVDITGLSVSITPTRSDSKILVMYDLCWGINDGHGSMRLMRDSTPIKIGDAASNRTRATGHWHEGNNSGDQYDIVQHSGTFLDEPATTSSTTYKLQVGSPNSASYQVYINRSGHDSDSAWEARTCSTITVMEVSG